MSVRLSTCVSGVTYCTRCHGKVGPPEYVPGTDPSSRESTMAVHIIDPVLVLSGQSLNWGIPSWLNEHCLAMCCGCGP